MQQRRLHTENLQNRHNLSDIQWEKIEPIIKERIGNWGGSNAHDNRVFVNVCLWIVRTGAPWRDLPPQYGNSMRFIAAIKDGVKASLGIYFGRID